jgi:hypothetical protein
MVCLLEFLALLGHGAAMALLHGLDDVLVAGAAADVAFERSRISSSLGLGLRLHRSTALITMPGVQKPHCTAGRGTP